MCACMCGGSEAVSAARLFRQVEANSIELMGLRERERELSKNQLVTCLCVVAV